SGKDTKSSYDDVEIVEEGVVKTIFKPVKGSITIVVRRSSSRLAHGIYPQSFICKKLELRGKGKRKH
ncbi:hypothetical protein, partial [Klebsiella variicola]|uniref:hypothetical protein n=1 Tax=Klebsiella variicola TaxID=244366 RepID=UPI00273026FD